MISSRQVVELIQDEAVMESDLRVKQVYKKLVKKIEVLEDNEMDNMYTDFLVHEEKEQLRKEEIRQKAEEEFKRAFKA